MTIDGLVQQKPYEHVVFKLHRHPITFVPIIVLFILLLLVPLAVHPLFLNLVPDLLTRPVLHPLLVLAGGAYYLIIFLFFYVRFIDYYLDVWIITNDRIIDVEQFGLFHKEITELDLFRIQDITVYISGFFGTLFHYGNVVVTTASSNTQIIFKNISHPNRIREQLIRLADEDRKYHHES